MAAVDVPIRSPTGTAWFVACTGAIAAGELYYELRKETVAELFGIPWLDAELWPWVLVAACGAAMGFLWLAQLYLAPGRLTLDAEADRITRARWRGSRRIAYHGPLAAWSVRVVFYSEADVGRGAFRRIELAGPEGLREVLLPQDVRDGPALVAALDRVGAALGAYQRDVIRGSGVTGFS